MRKCSLVAAAGLLLFGCAAAADADLNAFLSSLNAQAQADLPGFKTKLSNQFGVPLPAVESIFAQVRQAGDAFLCLQLGQMTRQPLGRVVETYRHNHGNGWGVIARELGIKPGSADFHALKRGNFAFTGEPRGASPGTGKGKGKAKGKNQEHP